jgi:hypothetical protein
MQLTTTPCVVRATIQPVCARAQHNLALPFAARRTSARCSLRCVPAKIDLNAGTGACADDGMVRMYTCSAQPTASVARFASGGVVALRAARHRGAAVRGSARRSTGVVTMAKVDAAVMINDVTGKMGRAVAQAATDVGLTLVPYCFTGGYTAPPPRARRTQAYRRPIPTDVRLVNQALASPADTCVLLNPAATPPGDREDAPPYNGCCAASAGGWTDEPTGGLTSPPRGRELDGNQHRSFTGRLTGHHTVRAVAGPKRDPEEICGVQFDFFDSSCDRDAVMTRAKAEYPVSPHGTRAVSALHYTCILRSCVPTLRR